MKDAKSRALAAYIKEYGENPAHLVRAPGRVNIIGEHTDYNDGFVLPCAIDRDTVVALGPSKNDNIKSLSCDFDSTDEFSLAQITSSSQEWAQYIRGMAKHLILEGYQIKPTQLSLAGDVPLGSGLSSSASLEIAIGLALLKQSKIDIQPTKLAQIAQKAENQFVGCSCGIMDQLISAKAQKDHALLIDCRTLDTSAISIPESTAIIIVNSGITHSNTDGEYNQRRAQCEQAAKHYGVRALRDIDMTILESQRTNLQDIVYRRARHVVSENERTLSAAEALKNNDLQKLGYLMRASHASMRDDFEITLPAIDNLSDMMNNIIANDGGARMTGGGFGGCVVGITTAIKAEKLIAEISTKYRTPLDEKPAIFKCKAWSGAAIIN